jgi:hypothetical protein
VDIGGSDLTFASAEFTLSRGQHVIRKTHIFRDTTDLFTGLVVFAFALIIHTSEDYLVKVWASVFALAIHMGSLIHT